MSEEWFSYQELGERLGVSPEAARQKAIRGRWPRRTANDGKAQVRVDLEDVKATMPVRKPKDEEPADDRPTDVEQAVERESDTQTFAALEAHIATLKAMAERSEQITNLERERANNEQARADRERDRADAERERMTAFVEQLQAANQEAAKDRTRLESDLGDLRRVVSELKRPWWSRIAS
jgi:chromosome segregation ATPase